MGVADRNYYGNKNSLNTNVSPLTCLILLYRKELPHQRHGTVYLVFATLILESHDVIIYAVGSSGIINLSIPSTVGAPDFDTKKDVIL